MEPLKPARKNGSMSAPQSPALSAQPPLGDGETWMMGGPRFLLTGPREVAVLRGSASGPTGSFGRAPPAHSRIPPSILLSRNGPGSMMPHAVVASPLYWVLAQGRQLHWSSLSLAPQSREREPQAQPHHLLCTMSVRKRTLLKVIILGDSGCVSPPPAAPKTAPWITSSRACRCCAQSEVRRAQHWLDARDGRRSEGFLTRGGGGGGTRSYLPESVDLSGTAMPQHARKAPSGCC
jgi:hypothetical protein